MTRREYPEQCKCGEPVNPSDAAYIAEAGYPEHASDCKDCMPRNVATRVRMFVGRGEP